MEKWQIIAHLSQALNGRQAAVFSQCQRDTFQGVSKCPHGILLHACHPLSFCLNCQAASNLSCSSAVHYVIVAHLPQELPLSLYICRCKESCASMPFYGLS